MDKRLQPAAYAETLRTLGRLYRDAGKFAEAHTALDEALAVESEHAPRSDARVSATLQAIADTYRAQGDLEKAAEYYQKVTVYANMSRRASAALRETLDELDRRRETLRAAQQSLQLLDRSDNATLKDRAFVYALIAYAHAQLSQPERSVDAIRALLHTLSAQADQLSTEHTDGDARALAWLLAAHQAERQGDIAAAEFACGAALEAVRHANLQWVIEQVMHALESDEISYNEE
jgi:tetratricopeptide (TPR) repeat protein